MLKMNCLALKVFFFTYRADKEFQGGLIFNPPLLKELVYWVRASLNTTLLVICISHVNVIPMKGCYHNEKAVTDGRTDGGTTRRADGQADRQTDGRQERVLELELCSQLKILCLLELPTIGSCSHCFFYVKYIKLT